MPDELTEERVNDLILEYVNRLEHLAKTSTMIDRFFLWQDDELVSIEEDGLDCHPQLYVAIRTVYTRWLAEMSPRLRNELFAHNDELNGANRNWLLDEIGSRYALQPY